MGAFKMLNPLAAIVDYPNLWRYVRELYTLSRCGRTVNMQHNQRHYVQSIPPITPSAGVGGRQGLDQLT